jgi:hypothetical protein
MNDPTNVSRPSAAIGRGQGLQVGQVVEVKRGALAGISGVLIGFSSDQNCLIELNIVQRGVALIIDRAAVRKTNSAPAGPDVCD